MATAVSRFNQPHGYAHMQATGMVNDHIVECFLHRKLAGG